MNVLSPCLMMQYTSEGLKRIDAPATSLQEAIQYEPSDGVYTIANTQGGDKVLNLSYHLQRLTNSAHHAEIGLTLDAATLRQALRAVIETAQFGDVRFRISIPRATPNMPYLSVEPFQGIPEQLIQNGIQVVTSKNSARHHPTTKDTAWMMERQKLLANLPAHIYEVILLDERGFLLEGTSSNFYAIRGGELYTATAGVLKGSIQQIVLQLAPSILPVHPYPIHQFEMGYIAEAFITSSSRLIVPVIGIDHVAVNDGKPSEFTQKLRHQLLEWASDHLETI